MANQIKIALTGKMRSGKDTVADYLVDKYEFTPFRFSEGIWATIRLLYPQAAASKEKPRRLLQEIGQKLRMVDENIWVNYMFNEIERLGASLIVVTDLRQPNEYQALRENGFFIVRVKADEGVRLNRIMSENDNFTINDLHHETEMHLDSFKVDYELDNNGTLEDLHNQIEVMFNEINPKGGKQGGDY
ncbi:AAA family ATPase [Terrihalobacillus insolitus]|uniref:deoxynucleotide monophosphate kinase family protein n=1 Tax=Terrihalobacillus insolitus TaxID=2950438 RepID=UPI002340BCB2|nr:AAA family ATPase [Terrihalobacillus insolitus]MDC3413922.1 AAA family ATPase [Terrihalobacillus insolitus]